MQLADEIQSSLRVGRTFHVNARKVSRSHGSGLGDQSGHEIACQLLVHIKTHVSEFQADIRIQLLGGDVIQQLMIKLSAGSGLISVGYIFSKVVDGYAAAGLVDGAGCSQHVIDLSACDKTTGKLLSNGGTLSHGA